MSAEMKWTKGPWRVEPFRSDARSFTIFGLADAIVTYVVTGDAASSIPAEVVKANAFLIAAAPDLYAALEALLTEEPLDPGHVWTRQMRERASAALSRARGER